MDSEDLSKGRKFLVSNVRRILVIQPKWIGNDTDFPKEFGKDEVI
ncbi:hypothetical protein [Leptospira noumeaensis]|nr:hypothetical protein [Leptospira noumeaensis]